MTLGMKLIDKLKFSKTLQKNALKYFVKKEKGEFFSKTLREYCLKYYNVNVGMYSYGACLRKNFNMGGLKIEVGRYCSFADNIKFFGANHNMESVSMSPLFYNKIFSSDLKDVKRYSLNIGNDVWIGSNVIITCGCSHIGNGAVIGAGAIVTHDVEPYTIVAGNPARVIRKRFDDDTIKLIEESKWWEMNYSEVIKHYKFMENPSEFVKNLKI